MLIRKINIVICIFDNFVYMSFFKFFPDILKLKYLSADVCSLNIDEHVQICLFGSHDATMIMELNVVILSTVIMPANGTSFGMTSKLVYHMSFNILDHIGTGPQVCHLYGCDNL